MFLNIFKKFLSKRFWNRSSSTWRDLFSTLICFFPAQYTLSQMPCRHLVRSISSFQLEREFIVLVVERRKETNISNLSVHLPTVWTTWRTSCKNIKILKKLHKIGCWRSYKLVVEILKSHTNLTKLETLEIGCGDL